MLILEILENNTTTTKMTCIKCLFSFPLITLAMGMIAGLHANVTDHQPPAPLPEFKTPEQLAKWRTEQNQKTQAAASSHEGGVFYTGKPYLAESSSYAFKYREYNPEMGRWTTVDPSGFPDGPNNRLYAAVPTSEIDLFGCIVIGIYGAGGNTVGNAALDSIANATGATMYGRDQQGTMIQAIENARSQDAKTPVIIFGYSRGGVAASQLANSLKNISGSCCVDLLVIIDAVRVPFDPALTVSRNVETAYNYYQKNGGPFSGTAITNPSSSYANIDLTSSGVDHNGIVDAVKDTVISEIRGANHTRSSACE